MGRAAPRPLRCGLHMGRSAQPMRWPACFHGPARATAHDKWRADAATMTTSTRPMRRSLHFRGPARAAALDMRCTAKLNYSFCISVICIWPRERTAASSSRQLAAQLTILSVRRSTPQKQQRVARTYLLEVGLDIQ